MNHIAESNVTTPYISFSTSYSVALAYALHGENFPTGTRPAYVYEIEIDEINLSDITVIDPIRHITSSCPKPPAKVYYHHDGDQEFLLGVVQPITMKKCRLRPKRFPPGSHNLSEPANLSKELRAIVFALRDSEVWIRGAVPTSCIVGRYSVTTDNV